MKRLAFVLLFALGCATGIGADAADREAPASTLAVNNEYREPVHVYVEHAGARTRQLGIVESFSRRAFVLQRSDAHGGALQLLIIAYTDGMTVRTDAVASAPGQSFALDIGPVRGQQFLYARPAP